MVYKNESPEQQTTLCLLVSNIVLVNHGEKSQNKDGKIKRRTILELNFNKEIFSENMKKM